MRVSLGGVHDEAEIRGHRRTYIGWRKVKVSDSRAAVDFAHRSDLDPNRHFEAHTEYLQVADKA